MVWKERLIFLGLGLALGMGQAPFGFSFLYFLILPFLAYCVRQAPNAKIAFGVGWWTGLGYFALSLNWIVEPFFVKPEVHGWMAPFALIFMAGGLALFWGGAFASTARLFPQSASRVIGLAVLWSLFEYLRGTIFTGFPWANLTYAWVDLPIIQLAAWFGIYGLGLVVLIVVFLPAVFAPNIWKGASLTAMIFVLMMIAGQVRMMGPTQWHEQGTVVRILQPNAAQHLKWRRDMIDVFYNRQLGYSAARTAVRPDVVIWSETALPFLLGSRPNAIQEVADKAGPTTSVIAGIVRSEAGAHRNSLVFIDERGGVNAVYDKHHLVPFGEYFPYANFFKKFGLQGLTEQAGTFQSGDGPMVINGHNVPNFLPLICYEAIFPSYAFGGAERPDWLVHITNDAWFGTFSGPYQHLVQSRLRAIEQGLPMVRAANTGISAMIDPYGRVLQSLPLGTQGYLDAPLPAPLSPTLYSKTQEWPWIIVAFLIFAACILTKGFKSERSEFD